MNFCLDGVTSICHEIRENILAELDEGNVGEVNIENYLPRGLNKQDLLTQCNIFLENYKIYSGYPS